MLQENDTLENVKHEILMQVASHAYIGDLKEAEPTIPYTLVPGPAPKFRCCIYREREIVRQRVRMAQGLPPVIGDENRNTIQIITSACEGCPITRYVVTDNCQRCTAKRCQQACQFDAITMNQDRAHIDPQICKECGKCSKACPYNAIADLMRPCKRSCPVNAITMDENHIVVIDDKKCIRCGQCIKNCPFGAIWYRSSMTDVINEIRAGKKVYAMVAPAAEGQFGSGITMRSLAEGIQALGFTKMLEVAAGGDLVADSEAEEWAEAYENGVKMTTSCCPAFVNLIKKQYPQLLENMSTTVSPMAAVSRYIKSSDPEAVTVFIGPCIAKKSEVCNERGQGNADYALTFEELQAMFDARDIVLQPGDEDVQEASIYGKRFANAGGVTKAVLESMTEKGIDTSNMKVRECNGTDECKKALLLLKSGRLPEDFIEGMCCEGGCVNGPASVKYALESKRDREQLLAKADDRTITESVKNITEQHPVKMHRMKQ